MSPRRAVSEELSREKIMRAATEMFVAEGYRAVSMRKIAQALGYSHGAIYYHFKDKAELFSAIVSHDFNRLAQRLEEVLQSAPIPESTLLENVFMEFIRFGFENKAQFEIMFLLDDMDVNQYSAAAKNISYYKFAQTVMRVIGANQRINQETTALTWSVFLSLHGFVAYYLHAEQTFEDIQELAHKHAKLLYGGMLSMLN